MKIPLLAIVVLGSLAAASISSYAAEGAAQSHDLKLSPDLLNLLRAEMREISSGVQGITLSLATADWKSIQDTGEKIRASYIMEKKLTPAQSAELEKALPAQFKQLDSEFHQRAEKLGAAAAARDAELVVFHYSRLLESCARCHSTFAGKRFPAFAAPVADEHHH